MRHEALITEEKFEAAHRGHVRGRRRGKDLLSGRVLCGMCGKRMSIEINGDGRAMYRCRSRGQCCDQPRRTNKGLHRAARLGLGLLAHDEQLREAIRRHLGRTGRTDRRGRRRAGRRPADALADLREIARIPTGV